MFVKSTDDFLREFLNFMTDPAEQRSKIILNAEDYSVFKIGSYDKETGKIETLPTLEHVVNMHDLRAQAKQKGIVPT